MSHEIRIRSNMDYSIWRVIHVSWDILDLTYFLPITQLFSDQRVELTNLTPITTKYSCQICFLFGMNT